MRISNIILKPIVTEKTTDLSADNKYVFKVSLKATKGLIAKDLKRLFDVDVLDVKVIVMPGKRKRIIGTRRRTKQPKWKKAIVKIKEGQSIDLFSKE